MSDFTPSTELVQRNYMLTEAMLNRTSRLAARAEFLRWLNDHDAQVAAQALWEAADTIMGPSDEPLDGATCRTIANTLRDRAAAIEARQS